MPQSKGPSDPGERGNPTDGVRCLVYQGKRTAHLRRARSHLPRPVAVQDVSIPGVGDDEAFPYVHEAVSFCTPALARYRAESVRRREIGPFCLERSVRLGGAYFSSPLRN